METKISPKVTHVILDTGKRILMCGNSRITDIQTAIDKHGLVLEASPNYHLAILYGCYTLNENCKLCSFDSPV